MPSSVDFSSATHLLSTYKEQASSRCYDLVAGISNYSCDIVILLYLALCLPTAQLFPNISELDKHCFLKSSQFKALIKSTVADLSLCSSLTKVIVASLDLSIPRPLG